MLYEYLGEEYPEVLVSKISILYSLLPDILISFRDRYLGLLDQSSQ